MKATIVRRAAAGTAVILSSHLLHLVEEICSRVLIMNRGQTVALGTVADIIASRPTLGGRRLEDVFLALITPEEEAPA
jgi:ABC-2 type transport system ATP-binding protein